MCATRVAKKEGCMMRYLLSVVVALVLLAGPAPRASASELWCETDPLVVITTPGGSQVPIYATNSALGLEHLPAVQVARISYTAISTEGGLATAVLLDVLVPEDELSDHFATRSVVSTGPLKSGTILASASGFSGQAMQMQFKLNVP
jgi:hypothetical protein